MQKLSKVVIALLCVIAVMGVALGEVIYTLSISNTMRLTLNTDLELRNSVDDVVTSYAWGDFSEGGIKHMYGEVGDGKMYLHNLCNGAVDVQWKSDVPSGWQLWLTVDGETWTSGTSMTIPVGGELAFEINMRELTAVGGQSYSYDLDFDIVS